MFRGSDVACKLGCWNPRRSQNTPQSQRVTAITERHACTCTHTPPHPPPPTQPLSPKGLVSPYVCGFAWSDLTWCMVVWCTLNNTPRQHQFRMAPAIVTTKQRCIYITLVDIQNANIIIIISVWTTGTGCVSVWGDVSGGGAGDCPWIHTYAAVISPFNNNNNGHLSGARLRPERSHDTH